VTHIGYNPVEILVVDDSEKDSVLIMRELRINQIANSVVVVKSGEEAIDYLFSQGRYATRLPDAMPRVVFLDLNMPGMSGLDTLKVIRADKRTIDLPVVIFTGSHDDPSITSAYAAGASSYVVKPVSLDQMRITIRQLGWYWLIVNRVSDGERSGFMRNGKHSE